MKQFHLSAMSGRWMGPFPDGSPSGEGEREAREEPCRRSVGEGLTG